VKASSVTPISNRPASNGQTFRQFVLNGQTVNVTDTIVYVSSDSRWLATFSCGSIPNSHNLYTVYTVSASIPYNFDSLSELRKALNAVYAIDSSLTTFEPFYQSKGCIYSDVVNIDTMANFDFNTTINNCNQIIVRM
jgi:hypothetical protein